jgi:CTP synthase (UTP-ammonia lyase)
MTLMTIPAPPRIALVGDRSSSVLAHARIPGLLRALATGSDEQIEPYWLHTTAITSPADLAGFDGIWVVPGSPYANTDGVLAAIRTARTEGIPLLGTCGGFQYLLLEFARSVCGLLAVEHGEIDPEGADLLLVPLECKLFGEEDTVIVGEGTTAARAMGPGPSTERYFCRFGLNVAHEGRLREHGLVISGRSIDGAARIAELPNHPYFVGALFQPELASDLTWVHPLISAFAAAVRVQSALIAAVRPS